ncbi:lysoplasmalogenase family protein [Lacinutrix neustonica]|uniref:Lysoplasmalogenase family protein n=2 Tax=Lacinutrix neustonica TaxID=2980107 RepID=A0A9E8MW58_9FLAO|nr:lysoplasmalogenase family protein [Lacinutrix neustonica]
MIGIMYLITKNLSDLFFPTLIYLFSTILMGLFALLRKNEVNKKSYYFVWYGVIAALICDSISVLQIFQSSKILYPKITLILFYAISQYLIVRGILEETNVSKTDSVT